MRPKILKQLNLISKYSGYELILTDDNFHDNTPGHCEVHLMTTYAKNILQISDNIAFCIGSLNFALSSLQSNDNAVNGNEIKP